MDNKISEEIKRCVEEQMKEWRFSDDLIYDSCVKEVEKVKDFCEIKERDISGPIKTFLYNWGLMGRVLRRLDKGDKNKNWESQLMNKIQENCGRFKKFRTLHLEDCNIEELKSEIEDCYAAIKDIVKPTSAAKTLHLLSCNFFPLWDEAIRVKANNEFKDRIGRIDGTPEGYFNFMLAIQIRLRQYDKTLSRLSVKYNKPKLRILDMFLWTDANKKEKNEGDEHKEIRDRAIEILEGKGFKYHSAHKKGKGGSNIALFRDAMNSSVHFKDVDIIAWRDGETFIVEIETKTRPEHLMGVTSINVSNFYKIGEKDSLKLLEDITLYVIPAQKMRGKKKQQLENIEKYLKLYLKEGSLRDFKIVTIEEFEKLVG